MKKNSKDNKRLFYVVQFSELPSDDIDNYVCVPDSWIISRRLTDQAMVAYPHGVDNFETRFHAKRRTRVEDNWGVYMAIIKYESDTYKDAEYWIATKNNDGPIEEESNIKDEYTQPEPVLDRKLRSASQYSCHVLSHKTKKPQLVVKPYENPRKPMIKMSIKRTIQSKHQESPGSASMVPECSRRKQSIIIQNDQIIKSAYTEKTAATFHDKNNEESTQPDQTAENKSSTEPDLSNTNQFTLSKNVSDKQPSAVNQDHREELSIPIINVNEPTEVININQEVMPDIVTEKKPFLNETLPNTSEQHCQAEFVFKKPISTACLENKLQEPLLPEISAEQSTEDIGNNQETQLQSIMMDVPKTVPKSLNRAGQPFQLYQHPQLPYSTVNRNGYLNFQLEGIDLERSTEVIHDDQGSRSHDITDSPPSTSNHIPMSVQLATQHLEKLQRKRSLSVIKNPIHKESHHESKARNMSPAVQSSSKSTIQSSVLPSFTAIKQTEPTAQNHWQEVSQRPVMHNGNHTERNGIDSRFSLQDIPNNIQKIQRTSKNYFRRSEEIHRIDQRAFNPDITRNTSAVQNFSNIAHDSRYFVEQSQNRQYIPIPENFSQRLACMKNLHKKPNDGQILNYTACTQDMMKNGAYVMQNQPTSVIQSCQFLPQYENRYLSVKDIYLQQERLRHEQYKRLTMSAHTYHSPHHQDIKIREPSAAQYSLNVLNQLNRDFQHPQRRQKLSNPQNSQLDPDTSRLQVGIPVIPNSESLKPDLQKVTKRVQPPSILSKVSTVMNPSLLTAQRRYLLEDPPTQATLSERSTEQSNINRAAFPSITMVEPITITQNFRIQPTSSNRLPKTQFTPVDENLVYEHQCKKKLVVDQSTETDFIMEGIQFESKTDRSTAIDNSRKVMDSACQVDDFTMEEPLSSYEEVISDKEVPIDDKIISQQEVVSDHEMPIGVAPVETVNNVDCTGETIILESNTQDKSTSAQNLAFSNQQMHTRTIEEQQMLNEFVTLLIQMSTVMSNTFGMFNNLRNSIVQSAETYQKLVGLVQTFNVLGNSLITAPHPSDVTSPIPTISKERPTTEEKEENSNKSDRYNNSVNKVQKKNHGRRHSFVFPPDYDPKDSKWTLKYRKQMPGLEELLFKSGIYVNSLQLTHCKRISKNCKTLARLLLPEVFSVSALSVCSFTGGKANTFNNVDLEVRPGLDEHARMVLLTFVEEYGLQRGWDTSDTQGIMSGIRSKIQEMRTKYGQTTKS